MKSTSRAAISAVSALALSFAATSLLAQSRTQPAQRGGAPGVDTPNILVPTFYGSTRQLGVEVADEVRSRIQSEHSAKELYATTKNNIQKALEASGYPADSALNQSDLMALAKITHADYVVDGKAIKAGSGLRVEARLLTMTGQQTLAQPLPVVDGKDAGAVAESIDRNISQALKQMPHYKQCINDLREQKYDQAVKDGGLALAAYSNSTLARVCLLQAYDKLTMTDSVISTANAILAKDSASTLALANLFDAYTKKNDTVRVADIAERISDLEPMNVQAARIAIDALVRAGFVDRALRKIQTVLAQNPGDPDLLRSKWFIFLKASRWKEAIAAGEELAKVDTGAVNADFFNRQIGAAQQDSNQAKILQLAQAAGRKFSKDVSFQVLLAQSYRRAGQLQPAFEAARRATELDPKNSNAWIFVVATAKDLNQPDTAMALAVKGIAAGADKATLEPFLLGPVGAAVKKAQETKERADWEAALVAAQAVDAMAASPATKFFVGLSSFQVGLDALQTSQKLGTDKSKDAKDLKVKACTEAKVAEDMWAIAQVAILPGGAFNKDGAAQVMGAIQQYSEYIPQMKKVYCATK